MKISVRTTYEMREPIAIEPVSISKDWKLRGVYYWPDCDDVAATAARPAWERMKEEIRRKVRIPELPVELGIEQEGDRLYAVAVATRTSRH